MSAVARVNYRRDIDTGPPEDTRYYICNSPADAATLLAAARSHWSIENSLHWVLDMAFDEDHSRVRTGHADQNLAVMRHLALNLLKQERSAKVGIKAKRKKAGWDFDYLLKVLSQCNAIALRRLSLPVQMGNHPGLCRAIARVIPYRGTVPIRPETPGRRGLPGPAGTLRGPARTGSGPTAWAAEPLPQVRGPVR